MTRLRKWASRLTPISKLAPLALLAISTIGLSQAQTLSKLAERGFAVIPEPREVRLDSGDRTFGPAFSVHLSGTGPDEAALESLRDHLQERYGLDPASSGGTAVQLEIRPGSVKPGAATGSDRTAIAEQAYSLEIGPAGVQITANAAAGLFYGVQTLVQLIHSRNGTLWLPTGRIVDWPDLPWRHIYWDDAHHLDRLTELKRAIRQAAFYKINGFALKLEGHFLFTAAPSVVEPYAMTSAEYQELTDYALRRHVELIPYLDGPAHLAFLLKHPEFARFRAFPDSNYELCIANPEAVQLLFRMFQNLIDANRGGRFVYFSTDEPYYIGLADNAQCREKPLANRSGVGHLLADFITQVAAPMHSQGRTVIFWGEYPLKPADIDALPSYLVNGEVYGADYDSLYRRHGIRQMLYTSTQGEEPLFPNYFGIPNARLLHPLAAGVNRLDEGFREISYQQARGRADLIGSVTAGWGDMGLHPETFWMGYVTIGSAGWHPGTPTRQEAASSFYRLFYGDDAVNMNRVYQLMSQQAHFWLDSWDKGPSSRKPLFGNSEKIFIPRKPVFDQTLRLPSAPTPNLDFDPSWTKANTRRLEVASGFLADNDELLALLHDNARRVEHNRYNLEVYISIARLERQNLEMLLDIGRMCLLLGSARDAALQKRAQPAIEALDRAIDLARHIREQRNRVLLDTTATWEKSWFPRTRQANGRTFLHELDDVKDHLPDRTVDMRYLIRRELELPFGAWVESIRAARNAFASAHFLPPNKMKFDWLEMGSGPVGAVLPE